MNIQKRLKASSQVNRLMYKLLISMRMNIADQALLGRSPSVFQKIAWGIGNFLFFKHLKRRVGLGRSKSVYTDGSPINDGLFRLLHAFGINVKHIYGFPETQIIAMHRADDIRSDTVGPPTPGCFAKIVQGELILKGNSPFRGYFNRDNATNKRFDSDGWFHSGDPGRITEANHIAPQTKQGQ